MGAQGYSFVQGIIPIPFDKDLNPRASFKDALFKEVGRRKVVNMAYYFASRLVS